MTALRATMDLLLVVVAGAAMAPPAMAHQQGLSYGDYRVSNSAVEVQLRFAATDLAPLLPLDQDGDGQVTQHDLDLLGPALPRATLGELRVRSGDEPCGPAGGGRALLDERDGIVLEGAFTCPSRVGRLEVRLVFLELLAGGHTHLARIAFEGEPPTQRIAQAGSETLLVERRASAGPTAIRFLRLGVEHIFTGYDHIAFLVALLLLGGSLRALVGIVTSFTVAHSITLALAALDIVAPPAALTEPLIALSIVAVAAENLWVLRGGAVDRGRTESALRHRWMITFAFGLVHGFGFAAVLRELHLPRAGLATSLVTFNFGVEAGQICIVALALPALRALGRPPQLLDRTAVVLSSVVGLLGLFWFGQRILG